MQSSIPSTTRTCRVTQPLPTRARRASVALLHRVNVVRVQPRTSGSITDLLLALACVHLAAYTAPQRSFGTLAGSRGSAGGPARPSTGCDPCVFGAWAPTGRTGPYQMRATRLLGGRYLTRYRNQPDKSLHQSGAAMHHRPQDLERALSLSIPAAS